MANPDQQFTGPLSFLNGCKYQLSREYLIALGASQSFQAGLAFWQRYGRTIYNQIAGQLTYNASYINGTARPKPVLRTTSQSRIQNTEINWALGFFGPSFQTVPDPNLAGANSEFDVVIIEEGGTENNTLASYDSCPNANDPVIGYLGDLNQPAWVLLYLSSATTRLQQYVPDGLNLTINDTYAMQDICAYETNYLGNSDFCNLFTADEWAGFENAHDVQYFYDYAWGNPLGRAEGIGYVQELIARLTDQYITTSNSSVNDTLTSTAATFPLNQPFYADFSHDDIIISVLTALSLDYLYEVPSLTQNPPDPNRRFVLSHLVPFAARLITEVIGCNNANPTPQSTRRQSYTPEQYGYDPANASYKFVRMRLNNGILPLDTIRGGQCAGREDGMCALQDFVDSQADAYELSNYQYACFGNFSDVIRWDELLDFDGTINETYVEERRRSMNGNATAG